MNSTISDDFPVGNETCGWNLVTFEKDQEEEKIEFIDPYNSIWLKLITVLVYIVELLSSVICYAFVIYEQDYGHYRTLINQLIGYLYKVVSTICFKYYKVQNSSMLSGIACLFNKNL